MFRKVEVSSRPGYKTESAGCQKRSPQNRSHN